MIGVLVFVGGAVGAVARYLLDSLIRQVLGERLPWGTMTVNALGSFLLGLLTRAIPSNTGDWWALLSVGLCGSLTTFAAFSWQTVELIHQGRRRAAAANVVISLVVGLLAGRSGWLLWPALSDL